MDMIFRFFQDPWLGGGGSTHVTTIPFEEFKHLKVVDLLMEEERAWNMDLVQRVFNEKDQRRILSTPLSRRNVPYTIIWRNEPNGHYFVKSTYRVMNYIDIKERGGATWLKFWNLKVLGKVNRMF